MLIQMLLFLSDSHAPVSIAGVPFKEVPSSQGLGSHSALCRYVQATHAAYTSCPPANKLARNKHKLPAIVPSLRDHCSIKKQSHVATRASTVE
jgi:hypothetical protein